MNNIVKKLFIPILIIMSVFININNVSASSCDKEKYQCIICTYALDDSKNADYYGITYTARVSTDKDGNVSLQESFSDDSIKLDSKLSGNSFIKDDKLQCPPIYYVPDAVIGTKSIKMTSDKKNRQATFKDKQTNGKSFGEKTSSNTSKSFTCSNIRILYNNKVGADELKEVKAATEEATITVSGNNFSITQIDDKYKLEDNYISSSITINDFKDGCPNSIFIHCLAQEGSYTCSLKKYSDMPDDYTYRETGEKINGSSSDNDPYTLRRINNDEIQVETGTSDGNIKCSDYSVVRYIYIMIMILAPIVAMTLGILDYTRAVVASDMEKMKKFKKKLPIRLIALVLLFVTPYLITIILSFSDSIGYDLMLCITTGKDTTVNLNTNNSNSSSSNSNKNNSSTSTKNTGTKTTDLSSACSSACKQKNTQTTALNQCITSCKNDYNSQCDKITGEAKKTCYKSYAEKKAGVSSSASTKTNTSTTTTTKKVNQVDINGRK